MYNTIVYCMFALLALMLSIPIIYAIVSSVQNGYRNYLKYKSDKEYLNLKSKQTQRFQNYLLLEECLKDDWSK